MKKLYAVLIVSVAFNIAWISYTSYTKLPDRLTKVIDGDTIVINGTTHVRLWGIDAPELDQTCNTPNQAFAGGISWNCGEASKRYLESFFKPNTTLKCSKKDTDIYGRTVATCSIINSAGQAHDIGKSMVAAGYALDWPQYSKGEYAKDQQYASDHKLGVWVGYFQWPWDWRTHNEYQRDIPSKSGATTTVITIGKPFWDKFGKCLQTQITTDTQHYFPCKDWPPGKWEKATR